MKQLGKYLMFISSLFKNREKLGVYAGRILD